MLSPLSHSADICMFVHVIPHIESYSQNRPCSAHFFDDSSCCNSAENCCVLRQSSSHIVMRALSLCLTFCYICMFVFIPHIESYFQNRPRSAHLLDDSSCCNSAENCCSCRQSSSHIVVVILSFSFCCTYVCLYMYIPHGESYSQNRPRSAHLLDDSSCCQSYCHHPAIPRPHYPGRGRPQYRT